MRLAPLCLAVAAALAAPAAFAQSPWYAGISAGRSETRTELVANRESTIVNGFDIRTAFDASDGAWKVFAGYRLNRVLALEIDYVDLGEHRMVTSMTSVNGLPAAIDIRRKIAGWGVDVVATAPLDLPRLALYGRIGAFHSRLEASAELAGDIVFLPGGTDERRRTVERREQGLRYGVGAEYRFTDRIAARVEYQRHEDIGKPFAIGGTGTTGEADTDLLTAGVVFRF